MSRQGTRKRAQRSGGSQQDESKRATAAALERAYSNAHVAALLEELSMNRLDTLVGLGVIYNHGDVDLGGTLRPTEALAHQHMRPRSWASEQAHFRT
eukprot:scaffold432_cov345-Prasinococcus_capsulatus_cf.AAC.2